MSINRFVPIAGLAAVVTVLILVAIPSGQGPAVTPITQREPMGTKEVPPDRAQKPDLSGTPDSTTIRLYLDADLSNLRNSGLSIERGIRVALEEQHNNLAGRRVEIVVRDHHGNASRSLKHLKEFENDPQALAVFCGLHSPPVLANLAYIQEQQILLLDPWAAAGPITRAADAQGRNWVFRLSVDDTKAGHVLVREAIDHEGYKRPALLLEDTGWGRSNEKTIKAALAERGLEAVCVRFFDWKLGQIGAREYLADMSTKGADVIFLVANAPEGKVFVRAMCEREEAARMPIRSHWGITGGDFFDSLGKEILIREVDLRFLQTSFSFLQEPLDRRAEKVFRQLQALVPSVLSVHDLKAPVGFVHAYDLTQLLIAAVEEVDWSADMDVNRRCVRDALENLSAPVVGLVKTYRKPFRPFRAEDPDAHEALGEQDLRMAQYSESGAILLMPSVSGKRKGGGREPAKP